MTTIEVRMFAPDLPPAGVAATAGFAGGSLHLVAGARRLTVHADDVEVRRGGFDGQQWFLEWPTDGGRAAVRLTGRDLHRLGVAAMPADLRQRVEHLLGEAGRRRRRLFVGLALVALVAALPIVPLGAFWFNADRIAAWAANRVGSEQEQVLGEMAFAQLRPGLRLVETGPAPAMVAAIGARLTVGSHYRYRWFVADAAEVNALALPGGHVVVFTGLIKAADSAEEVAGVLAHEIQHVEMRHSLRNLIHGLGWRALLAVALGDLSAGTWGDLAERLGSLRYSRELERQADLGGLVTLRRAGIAPEGMATFFEKLARRDGRHVELLSSHPASEERMRLLRQAVARQGSSATRPLDYDWRLVQGSLR